MSKSEKELIDQSIEVIGLLEKCIKQNQIISWIQSCSCILFCYLAISSITPLQLLFNGGFCGWFLYGFIKKKKEIKEYEDLLDNAKFNESLLRACVWERDEKWKK